MKDKQKLELEQIFEHPGDRDPIKFYEMYTSRRPSIVSGPEDPFYLTPRPIPLEDTSSSLWYLRQKVCVKKLAKLLRTIKEKGQLEPSKRITNHSARKYLVQQMSENEVQSTDIMQIAGHKNVNSVNSYSSISEINNVKFQIS
jgi:hypothetical protein